MFIHLINLDWLAYFIKALPDQLESFTFINNSKKIIPFEFYSEWALDISPKISNIAGFEGFSITGSEYGKIFNSWYQSEAIKFKNCECIGLESFEIWDTTDFK